MNDDQTRPRSLLEAQWVHHGVSEILRTAAGGTQLEVMKTLLECKVEFSYRLAKFRFNCLTETMQAYHRQVRNGLLEVLGNTTGMQELRKTPRTSLFEKARAGTLQLDADVDPNFRDPATGMTALMVAAGHGQVELVKGLLARRASVNTQDTTRCTALTFAAECCHRGTAECMRLLIEARSVIHHVAGVQFLGPEKEWRHIYAGIGYPAAVGKAVCRLGDAKKFGILLEAGYDINLPGGSSHIFSEACFGGNMVVIQKLIDMRVDPAAVRERSTNPGFTLANLTDAQQNLLGHFNGEVFSLLLRSGAPVNDPYMIGKWPVSTLSLLSWQEPVATHGKQYLDMLMEDRKFDLYRVHSFPSGKVPHYGFLAGLEDSWLWYYLFDHGFDPTKRPSRSCMTALEIAETFYSSDHLRDAWNDWQTMHAATMEEEDGEHLDSL